MAIFEIGLLDPEPTKAANTFYSRYLPLVSIQLSLNTEALVIVFPAADHTHTGWRQAAVQSLARESPPIRVNAIAGGDGPAQLAAVRYLETASGITGQYLPLDDAGAGTVVSSQS